MVNDSKGIWRDRLNFRYPNSMDTHVPTYALVALVVSISSALITLCGLAWQLRLYQLQGARLKVQLNFCYYLSPMATKIFGESRKSPTIDRLPDSLNTIHGVEYGTVTVTNIGRTLVSVESIGFDLGRDRWYRAGRRQVTSLPFDSPRKDLENIGELRAPKRLEPGENVQLDLYIWPLFTSLKIREHRGARDLIVRGTATAVGHRPTLSRRRHAWRIPRGAATLFKDHVPAKETLVHRVLQQYSSNSDVWVNRLSLTRDITSLLGDGCSSQELRQYIESQFQGAPFLLASDIYTAFHNQSIDNFPYGRQRHMLQESTPNGR